MNNVVSGLELMAGFCEYGDNLLVSTRRGGGVIGQQKVNKFPHRKFWIAAASR
jgi:hypothetical protein